MGRAGSQTVSSSRGCVGSARLGMGTESATAAATTATAAAAAATCNCCNCNCNWHANYCRACSSKLADDNMSSRGVAAGRGRREKGGGAGNGGICIIIFIIIFYERRQRFARHSNGGKRRMRTLHGPFSPPAPPLPLPVHPPVPSAAATAAVACNVNAMCRKNNYGCKLRNFCAPTPSACPSCPSPSYAPLASVFRVIPHPPCNAFCLPKKEKKREREREKGSNNTLGQPFLLMCNFVAATTPHFGGTKH